MVFLGLEKGIGRGKRAYMGKLYITKLVAHEAKLSITVVHTLRFSLYYCLQKHCLFMPHPHSSLIRYKVRLCHLRMYSFLLWLTQFPFFSNLLSVLCGRTCLDEKNEGSRD